MEVGEKEREGRLGGGDQERKREREAWGEARELIKTRPEAAPQGGAHVQDR